jgi:BlaI family transcriptional regulator, penicillinase repressor
MTLTPLELDIMKAIWRLAPITVRGVREAIRPDRQLAYTSVMTIMDRLHRKGYVKRKLQSRAHYYEAAIDYADVRAEAVDTLIRSFFGSREKLIEFLEGHPEDLPPRLLPPAAPSQPGLDETLL